MRSNEPGHRPSNLRMLRLAAGLRLKDVELATGIADTTLSKLERGEIPLIGARLRALARLYEASPDRLREGRVAIPAGGGIASGRPLSGKCEPEPRR